MMHKVSVRHRIFPAGNKTPFFWLSLHPLSLSPPESFYRSTVKTIRGTRGREEEYLIRRREGRNVFSAIRGMDSDLWISRLAAAKRHYSIQQHQSSQSDRFGVDELEVEEDVRSGLPCPFCDEDHDITSLCSHLEDEHPFESKVAVCPICCDKVASDMLSHITLQHGHQFKLQRRRRLRRVAIPNSQGLSLLGRDLREAHLQVLLGNGAYRSNNSSASNAAADSFLSSLILKFPNSEAEDTSKFSFSDDFDIKLTTPEQTWKSSIDLSLSHEEREQKLRQAAVRANFVQDLLLSALFGGD